jgi:MFS family permease
MQMKAASIDRYAVLRLPNVRLYLLSRFIASLGQNMLGMAVGWELYERTHSAFALGLIGLAQITPLLLLTLPAGHLADQRDRRKIILWTMGMTSASWAGLTLVSWAQAPVACTYLFLFLAGIARAFLWPASSSFLPQIVPPPLFPSAVTWSSGSYQLSAALGPVLGGLAIPLTGGATAVYAFNVLATCLCCLLVWFVRVPAAVSPPPREKMTLHSLGAGLRFVLAKKIILGIISLDLFAVLFGGATALLPIYAKDILQVGAGGLGWLRAALPIGSASMALCLAHRPPLKHAGHALLLAVTGFGVATIIFGLSRWFWLSLAMMIACGALDNVSVIVRQTLVQVLTPDAMRGRVSAISGLFVGASNEFGEFESGLVASLLGPVLAVVTGGIGTILVVIATALIRPEIRRYGSLAVADEAPEETLPGSEL